jgi:hypothetical protein
MLHDRRQPRPRRGPLPQSLDELPRAGSGRARKGPGESRKTGGNPDPGGDLCPRASMNSPGRDLAGRESLSTMSHTAVACDKHQSDKHQSDEHSVKPDGNPGRAGLTQWQCESFDGGVEGCGGKSTQHGGCYMTDGNPDPGGDLCPRALMNSPWHGMAGRVKVQADQGRPDGTPDPGGDLCPRALMNSPGHGMAGRVKVQADQGRPDGSPDPAGASAPEP